MRKLSLLILTAFELALLANLATGGFVCRQTFIWTDALGMILLIPVIAVVRHAKP